MSDKKVIETFRDFDLAQITQDEPSYFNGIVRVTRYRVTIETIEEPVEVIRERLRKMWAENKNYHAYEPLHRMGKKYGIDLHQLDIDAVREGDRDE